ncbi:MULTISPECIES: hypothetical protein [Rufibacter]|uniref:Uncharacterized protein n=1 Tax=Rufibacter quisquiliarum TaxID=1549639 RepID=A0A839GWP8_9BACT|nr:MULTISPECIES: hypothetical protein [Rufibacter]MBA9078838.1 hypothetical protein [Rufibacter quisquiliarum]
MKKQFFFFLLLMGLLQVAKAQKVVSSFQQAEGTAHSMQKLDARYKSAVHADSSLAVFRGNDQARLVQAYQQLLQELGRHLAQNNFTWGKPTRCFNRFYFSPDGSVDYYLFHLNPQEVDAQKQAEFQRLMHQFIQTHRLSVQAPVRFSQCSPVVYQDPPANR